MTTHSKQCGVWFIFATLLYPWSTSTLVAAENSQSEVDELRSRLNALEAEISRRHDNTIDEKEGADSAEAEQPAPVKLGGALRFNYFLKDYDSDLRTRYGDTGFDLFRLNADGQFDNLVISVEYRFYSYMNTIHHGYVGYTFDDHRQVQLGIHQVPFGLLPYDAHNFWFGVPYYLGLGDDYDSGVKYIHSSGAWNWHAAFYKNEELGDAGNLDRYSYDPVTSGAGANEETNTVNLRGAYVFNRNTDCEHELGLSGQRGELFNLDTGQKGDHWAAAAHLDSHCGRWNIQLQGIRYAFNARNPTGADDTVTTLGAFSGDFDVASEGDVYTANVAYNIDSPWPQVNLLTCYNDFSMLDKKYTGMQNSYLNTLGCLVNIGPTYTYIDLIYAENMVFLGNGSLAGGGSDDREARFNINFGIYW